MLPQDERATEASSSEPGWRLWDVVLAVALGIGSGFMLVALFALVVGLVSGSEEELTSITAESIATTIVYAALLASVYLVVVLRRKLSWRDVGLHAPNRGFILMTLFVWVVMIIATVLVAAVVSSLFGDPPDVREQLSVGRSEISGAEVFWLLIASVVAAPVVEEVVFRGLLFPSLRKRWPFWAAALVSAVLFAAVHLTLILVPALTVLGLALAWLKERYDSVYPAIVLHGLNNGLAIVILLTLTD